VDTNALLKGK